VNTPFVVSKKLIVMLAAVASLIAGRATYRTYADQLETPAAAAPEAQTAQFIHPKLKSHGQVVRLPDAVEQPRAGSNVCVDITADGPVNEVHPAIDKVARFVNIYAGAGKQPAEVKITVVLHGGATQVALSDVEYRRHLKVDSNPNTQLVRELCEAGVEFIVCGQALAHKGFSPEGVTTDIKIAVSALTANVNRQADGYAVVQLK